MSTASPRGTSPPLSTSLMTFSAPSTRPMEAAAQAALAHPSIITEKANPLLSTQRLNPLCLVSVNACCQQHLTHNIFSSDAEARAASEKQRQEEQVSVTRHKVEALRKIMEERKAKREARRQAKATPPASAASYSTAWSVSEAREADQEAEHFLQQPEPVTA